jgi:hypothetical protein
LVVHHPDVCGVCPLVVLVKLANIGPRFSVSILLVVPGPGLPPDWALAGKETMKTAKTKKLAVFMVSFLARAKAPAPITVSGTIGHRKLVDIRGSRPCRRMEGGRERDKDHGMS